MTKAFSARKTNRSYQFGMPSAVVGIFKPPPFHALENQSCKWKECLQTLKSMGNKINIVTEVQYSFHSCIIANDTKLGIATSSQPLLSLYRTH